MLRRGAVGLVAGVVLATGGCASDATPEEDLPSTPSESESSASPAFDPLSVEQPERPDLSEEGPFTAVEGREYVRYHFDAWRYAARTGYEVDWKRARGISAQVGSPDVVGCLDLDGELQEHVFEPSHRMEVDEVGLDFQKHAGPRRFAEHYWARSYLVEVRLPERRVVAEDGSEVTVLDACEEVLVIQVVSQRYRGPMDIDLIDPSARTA